MSEQHQLWYLAHPVAPVDGETQQGNLDSAKEYLRALAHAGLHVIAPWIGLCEALDDSQPSDREIGIAIDNNALLRCDGVICCGPRMSPGMSAEVKLASTHGLQAVSLVGASPEDVERERAWGLPVRDAEADASDESANSPPTKQGIITNAWKLCRNARLDIVEAFSLYDYNLLKVPPTVSAALAVLDAAIIHLGKERYE